MDLKQGSLLALFAFVLAAATAVAAPPVRGSMSVQGDLVHAEFEGRANWDYDLKRVVKNGKTWIEVLLDPVAAESVRDLGAFKSDFVRAVKVDSKGPDGKTLVSFELAGEEVESFDYLTDQPSRLVVDFYVSEKTKARKKSETAAAKKETKVETAAGKTAKSAGKDKTDKARKPANDALVIADNGAAPVTEDAGARGGIFDGGDPDFERFSIKDYEYKEEAVLRSRENYYIPFPALLTRNENFDKIRAAAPVYAIAPKDDQENKMARLLLTLFQRKRYAVYLKTLTWFREKYPDSKYNDLIDYMTGDVHLARWEESGEIDDYERAIQAYQSAVQKYPEAPTAERASFLIGLLALDRGDSLGALRAFENHVGNAKFGGGKPTYSKDLAKLGLGFGYMKLFRTEEALKAFDDVEKTSTFRDLKSEAAYRKGDARTAAKQYVKAIEDYERALKNYPEGRDVYPGAAYNRAEALFQTGGFRPALDTHRDFIKRFPSNEQVPYAMTRLGELLEILGADPTRVIGAYLETAFRFGENPKAIIARLHLLSARMKGMKTKETDNAVKEILSLAKKLDLPNIEQFSTILTTDGYTSRGEFDKSIDLLTKFYQENPTSTELKPIEKRIVSNIAKKFRAEVNSGKFIDALRTHQKYADGWLKSSDRLDVKFYLGRAFEMGGVQKEAETLYKDVLNRMYAVKGTPAEKALSVLEYLPSREALHLRLAAVADKRKNMQEAYDQLRLIKQPEKLSDEEQIERVDLAVRLLEDRGDLDSASRYLTELLRTWEGKPELVAGPYLRLSQIELKQGKKDDAVRSLSKIDTLMQDSGGKVPAEIHAKALEALGDLYFKSGDKEKAAGAYARLLEKYEETRPLASIRYRLGQIAFEKGEVQKAAETWASFKGDKSGFWKNLAQEQLANSDWRDGYKKYIKRIPAMNESKE